MTEATLPNMPEPEYSYIVKLDEIGPKTSALSLSIGGKERRALAKRFDLASIEAVFADLSITKNEGKIEANGMLRAKLHQYCVISSEEVAAKVNEAIAIRFVRREEAPTSAEEEIELAEDDCDVQFYEGESIDVGEAISQSLILALDPFPRGPNADKVAEEMGLKGEQDVGPFSALKALKEQMEQK